MSNTAIIAFNAYSKKLTRLLNKIFKACDKAIPSVTGNTSKSDTQFFHFCFKFSNGFKVSLSSYIGDNFTCFTVIGVN